MKRLSNVQLFVLVFSLAFTITAIVLRIAQGYWLFSN